MLWAKNGFNSQQILVFKEAFWLILWSLGNSYFKNGNFEATIHCLKVNISAQNTFEKGLLKKQVCKEETRSIYAFLESSYPSIFLSRPVIIEYVVLRQQFFSRCFAYHTWTLNRVDHLAWDLVFKLLFFYTSPPSESVLTFSWSMIDSLIIAKKGLDPFFSFRGSH